MSSFEKIIGYSDIKKELVQICDMLKNEELYSRLGAKLPGGMLLSGNPGLGKTLMAKCFIEECELETFTIKKDRSEKFTEYITETFNKAKEKAPCIVFLDDMDKFANEDQSHRDSQEYVAIQSGIDEVKGTGVFVLATANDIRKLPDSLRRAGRFDRHIKVPTPGSNDCKDIIKYYLRDKKVSDNVNIDDVVKMINYSSCAELETILNEAAINAGYERKTYIETSDIVSAVLKMEYNSPHNFTEISEKMVDQAAWHEAGHLIMSELLCPGSVGLVSLKTSGRDSIGGFVRRCKNLPSRESYVLVSLAGKAAVELTYGVNAAGCESDIMRACDCIRSEITESGSMGFGMIDTSNYRTDASEFFNSRIETVIQAELERYMYKAKEIILKNKSILEKTVKMLLEKEILLASDIQKILEETKPVHVE